MQDDHHNYYDGQHYCSKTKHLHERIIPLRGAAKNYFNPVTFSEMRGHLYTTVNYFESNIFYIKHQITFFVLSSYTFCNLYQICKLV